MSLSYRIFSEDEAVQSFPKRGQTDLTEYEEMLKDVIASPTMVAEIPLGGLSPRAMKRRVGQAARRLDRYVKWGRQFEAGDPLRFKVMPITMKKSVKESDGRRKHNKSS